MTPEAVSPFYEGIDAIRQAGGEAFKYCYQCGKCDTVCPWNWVEMDESRQNSLCCSGGGSGIWMKTAKVERFADLRLAQARETGASILVTACPYCITNFEESRLGLGDAPGIEIKDITEIIQEVI